MEKTVKEWLEQLPDGYRERALSNMDAEYSERVADSMEVAIVMHSHWSNTREGFSFWYAVYEHCNWGKPLPPLPQDEPKPTATSITLKSSLQTWVAKTSDPDSDYWELDVDSDGDICLWKIEQMDRYERRIILTQDRAVLEALKELLNHVNI
jgi:hypothetical protein